jgi:hypothetical protein
MMRKPPKIPKKESKGKKKRKKGHIRPREFGILMSVPPVARVDEYHILTNERRISPLKQIKLPKEQTSVSLDIGRSPEEVHLPVPFYKKGGVTNVPSKMHGTLTATVVHDKRTTWLKNVRYIDSSRAGTKVFELSKTPKSTSHRHMLGVLDSIQPHSEQPYISGDSEKILKVRPNRTILVFGVHQDTPLRVVDYTDTKGNQNFGFIGPNGRVYPWMMVTAPREKK